MQIEFHVLEETSEQRSLLYLCQLIEKAHGDNRRLYIHTNNQEEAQKLDQLLWTYRDDSFLPHSLYNPDDDLPPPIQIGHGHNHPLAHDILVNLADNIPPFSGQFKQIIEIVFSNPTVQQLARERYKQYRDQGHEITTIKQRAL